MCDRLDPGEFHPIIHNTCRLVYEERALQSLLQIGIAQAMAGTNRSFQAPSRNQPTTSRQPAPFGQGGQAVRPRRGEGSSSSTSRRCLICGNIHHSPLKCTATELVNGKPLLLRVVPGGRGQYPKRVDDDGSEYCFLYNGVNGCQKPLISFAKCEYGRHACTFCKKALHGAQACPTL